MKTIGPCSWYTFCRSRCMWVSRRPSSPFDKPPSQFILWLSRRTPLANKDTWTTSKNKNNQSRGDDRGEGACLGTCSSSWARWSGVVKVVVMGRTVFIVRLLVKRVVVSNNFVRWRRGVVSVLVRGNCGQTALGRGA